MRQKNQKTTLTAALLGLTATLAMGLLDGCSDPMTLIDDDVEKRRDLSTPPPPHDMTSLDMTGPLDMKSPGDMAMRGDMTADFPDMGSGSMDMATGGMDMTTGRVDMASPDMASPVDMAMPDMAMPDMAMPDMAMPDMSTPDMTSPRDLSMIDSGHVFTCRGADAPGTVYQVVTDSLLLPTGAAGRAFTYDYDGSGRLKNQLKTLIQTVAVAGLDLQTPIDAAVKSGSTLQLASLKTADLTNSTCAGLSVVPAKPAMMPPKFDGSDMLEQAMTSPAELIGSIATSKLTTKASKSLLPTEDAVLELQLSIGAMALALPIHGLQVEGTVERVGGITRIKNGIIHGVVAASDIDMRIFPAVATLVTNLINSDPMSSTTKTIISLFENTANPISAMKCMTPSKCCKTNPATCVILPGEVKISVVGGIIVPDVQVFDAMGNWKPVSGGAMPNGMTVGVGFTAVTATYR